MEINAGDYVIISTPEKMKNPAGTLGYVLRVIDDYQVYPRGTKTRYLIAHPFGIDGTILVRAIGGNHDYPV